MNEALSLFELTGRIKNAIGTQLSGAYWVRAEISEGRQNTNGHYYCRFIEKNRQGTDIASAAGIIWAGTFLMLRSRFERTTGQRFGAGIKVLVKVRINFHERYGLSLIVEDIDPSYTLGDMVRRRREIIARLTTDGVVEMNKRRILPRPLLRIAVITSETAAGYGDFCNHIQREGAAFNFNIKLFPAIMQGDRVESSIVEALNVIASESESWDAVAIIRGGGAVSDLNGFDTYPLAANVAQFPLPVITGIGHDRDETVLDLVAKVRCKTPTAVADFLIGQAGKELALLDEYADKLKTCTYNNLSEQRQRLGAIVSRMPLAFSRAVENERTRLRLITVNLPNAARRVCNEERTHCERLAMRLQMHLQSFIGSRRMQLEHQSERLRTAVSSLLSHNHQRLTSAERSIRMAGPERVFRLGFSLTTKNGKAITDASQLTRGDEIVTRFAQGEVKSRVE